MSEWWDTLMTVEKVLYCMAVPSTIILIVQTLMLLFGVAGHEGYNPSDTSGIDFDSDFDGMHGGIDVGHHFGGFHDFDLGHHAGGLQGTDISHDIGGMHGADISHDIGGMHGADISHDIGGMHGADISHDYVNTHDGVFEHHDIAHAQPQDFDTLRIFTVQGIVAFFTVFSWSSIAGIGQGVPSVKSISLGIIMGMVVMYIIAVIIKYSRGLSEDGTFDMKDTLGHQAVVYLPIPPNHTGFGKVNVSVNNRFLEFSAVTEADRTIRTGESVRITDVINDSVVVEIE